MSGHQRSDRQQVYQVKLRGRLDARWSTWFHGMAITSEEADDGCVITTLTGPVIDQVELRGILVKIWDLNLTLVSVSQVEPETEQPVPSTRGDRG